MENTGKVIFTDDESARWYLAQGDSWLGPMTAAEVYEKVLHHEISWAHYAWKQGQSEWKRLGDIETFQAVMPRPPTAKPPAELPDPGSSPSIRRAPPRSSSPQPETPTPPKARTAGAERIWFLYYNDSQFGPFSHDEIHRYLKIGKIHGRVYGWKEGLPGWERLEKIPAFAALVPAPGKTQDRRTAPRRPLVAKILLANDEQEKVASGICRDISVGGMQVLIDQVPGKVGSKIKLNVSSSSDEKKSEIRPFVAEGVIVRLLEDGRGFSFRFEQLGAAAKRIIEEYLGQSA